MATDVCRCLGLYQSRTGMVNASWTTKSLSPDERRITRIYTREGREHGGREACRAMAIISESGLYKLVMRSDKPAARRFQDWVAREVLPSINSKFPRKLSCPYPHPSTQ